MMITLASKEEAVEMWKGLVMQKAHLVDPKHEHNFETLAYGFFLGMMFHPEEALEMAQKVER